jgi:hypothetical protein
MRVLNRVPSNDLYNRIQNNSLADKDFKKSILNMYKRHPNVAEKVVDVIDTIRDRHMVPKGSLLTNGGTYYLSKYEINLSDQLFKDIINTHHTFINNAENILVIVMNLKKDGVHYEVLYYLFEMEDGSFKYYYKVN